jgi:hypothetical protein
MSPLTALSKMLRWEFFGNASMKLKFWRSSRDRQRKWVLASILPGSICAEIGVWKGEFSAQILGTKNAVQLHLVDPWLFDSQFPKRWYGGAKANSQADMDAIYASVVRRFSRDAGVHIHRLRSVEAAPIFADGSLDWIYIDGDHSKAAVEADIRSWVPRIKSGGALVGDDYDWLDEAGAPSVRLGLESASAALGLKVDRIKGGQFLIRTP